MTELSSFVLQQSEDIAATELEWVHEPCGERLGQAEEGDTLQTVMLLAESHTCALRRMAPFGNGESFTVTHTVVYDTSTGDSVFGSTKKDWS